MKYSTPDEHVKDLASKRFTTALIGCLERIENSFGALWGQELPEDAEIDDEQAKWEEIWEEVRTQVLDYGHGQKRKFIKELDKFEIKQKRYDYRFKVVGDVNGNR